MNAQVVSLEGLARSVQFEQPSHCPVCHYDIEPRPLGNGFYATDPHGKTVRIEMVFRCPRKKCQRVFLARYQYSGDGVNEDDPKWWRDPILVPTAHKARLFDPVMETISSSFAEIYDQAQQAESHGLSHLSGPGYRKSLEFLIKDYLKSIAIDDASRTDIERIQLGPCISKYVKDPNVKSCAQRAAWLGNDETHYIKKWADKDLNDLKKLIDLTLYWIGAEILTQDLERSMPESGPPQVEAKAAN